MKRKGILRDPGFWILVGINGYLVYYYYQRPEIFSTLIWLYWCQSVLMGMFNFFDMLTVRKVEILPDTGVHQNSTIFRRRVPSAFFFLFHYGFFHLVYVLFIGTLSRSGPFQWDLFKYFLLAFLGGQIFTFVQHKIQQRTTATNLGKMFFVPYLRVVPMHLTILLPSFFHITNLGIFLILKALADVIMYVVTKPAPTLKEQDQAILATQQAMNM